MNNDTVGNLVAESYDVAPAETIPEGYECSALGVKKLQQEDDGKPTKTRITLKPVKVTALTRNESGNNWGVLVWWLDLDDKDHEIAIPKKLFHAQGTELAQLLADGGLQIIPGKEKELLRYLAAFNVKDKLIAASSTGWLGESFVMPTESINEPEGERIVYQPTGLSNISRAISKSGTLKEWQAGMVDASPMIMFYICASLSAPVRFKAGIEAGGFHAYNLTSQGKTTMLQGASSVWGNGVDPAIAGGDEAYIQRWNSTANALEAKAEAFNDLAMIIDEIGEGDPKEFGQTIYRIISGTGRGRSDRSGGLKDSKSWRVTILSAGEVAVSDFIESGGGRVKGGQMVRLVDLDLATIGKLFDSAEQANAMKKLCATHYGHAGISMIKKIPDLTLGWSYFDHSIIGEATTAIASRVRTRFALVAHTGIIAVRADILPWSEQQIIDAVKSAYTAWHDQINAVSDVDRGVVAVRDFILKHESRFEFTNAQVPPRDRAGWCKGDLYHFIPAAFKEACAGSDPVKVKQALNDAGVLHHTKGLNANIRVDGKTVTVVSVKPQIMSELSKNSSSSSSDGSKHDIATVSADTTNENQVVAGSSSDCATSATTDENELVAGNNRIDNGLIPPLLPIPVENNKTKHLGNNHSNANLLDTYSGTKNMSAVSIKPEVF